MGAMENALLTVASLTAIIALGFVVARTMELPRGFTDTLSKIVFRITLPCAIFHAFASNGFDASLLLLALVGLGCTFIPWLIGTLLTAREDRDHRILMMMNISGFNIGCFVLPFAQALFPPAAALAVCLFDAGNALMMSGGTYAFSVRSSTREDPITNVPCWLRSACFRLCHSTCIVRSLSFH